MDVPYDAEEVMISRNHIITFICNAVGSKLPIKVSDIIALLGKNSKKYNYCFPMAREALRRVCKLSYIDLQINIY